MYNSPQTGRAAPARLKISTFLMAAALAPLALQAAPPAAATPTAAGALRAIAARSAALPPLPPLTMEEAIRRPVLREVRMAPDGRHVAYLAPAANGGKLELYDVEQRSTRTLLKEQARGEVNWSRDGKTVFLAAPAAVTALNVQDGAASKAATLDPKREQRMVGVDPAQDAAVLIEEYDRGARKYRLSSTSADGASTLLYEGAQLKDFLLDTQGKPQFIKSLDEQFRQIVSRRGANGWQEVMRCKPARACNLVSASQDGRKLAMLFAHQDDRRALMEIDADSGKQRVLHTDPDGITDLRRVVLDPLSAQPLVASYDLPRRHNHALTPGVQRALGDFAARFPASNILPAPAAGGKRWLLAETGPRMQAERFWLYHADTRQFEQILGAEREQGKPTPEQRLADKHAVSYRASDGATIHGYLTLPPGVDAARAPLVTVVHGGPWTRFDSEAHWLVHWLASRGIAVFQPNFRASTGYGDKFMLAPQMDLGNGRVQRDIIEGVQWLQANGIGDSKRLAILGDSFGGYSTLLALTHTPDMFRFGLATVPPPDFARTIELAQDENLAGNEDVPTAIRFREMGLDKDKQDAMARLRAQSPAAGVARVVRPLVMIAGGKDEKVEISAVTAYAAALEAAGKPVTLLVEPAEGHNIRRPEARQAYMHFLERLLHEHFDGAAPPPPAPELARYLEQNVKIDKAFGARGNAMP